MRSDGAAAADEHLGRAVSDHMEVLERQVPVPEHERCDPSARKVLTVLPVGTEDPNRFRAGVLDRQEHRCLTIPRPLAAHQVASLHNRAVDVDRLGQR
jgi:hypothetical protein